MKLPEYMRDSMRCYLMDGIPPDRFLTAVLSNDLRGAFERGDDENILALLHYVTFLYHYAPSGAAGSEEKVAAWIKHGGLNGLERK